MSKNTPSLSDLFHLLSQEPYLKSNKKLLQILEPNIAVPLINFMDKSEYFHKRKMDNDGWFFLTEKQQQEQVCMSLEKIRNARKKLQEKGLIHVKRKGIPPKLYYKINVEKVSKIILEKENHRTVPVKSKERTLENHRTVPVKSKERTLENHRTVPVKSKERTRKIQGTYLGFSKEHIIRTNIIRTNIRRTNVLNYILPEGRDSDKNTSVLLSNLSNGETKQSIKQSTNSKSVKQSVKQRKGNNPLKLEFVSSLAQQLANIIQTKKRMQHTPSQINNWSKEINKLIQTNKVSPKRIRIALDWYSIHINDRYVPVIESGSSLRSKFLKLEDAINRSTDQGYSAPKSYSHQGLAAPVEGGTASEYDQGNTDFKLF